MNERDKLLEEKGLVDNYLMALEFDSDYEPDYVEILQDDIVNFLGYEFIVQNTGMDEDEAKELIEYIEEEIGKDEFLKLRQNKSFKKFFASYDWYDDEDEKNELKNAVEWVNKKSYVPGKTALLNVPSEKIDEFDKNIWFKMVKSAGLSPEDESELRALLNACYVFGVFRKDIRTLGENTLETSEKVPNSKNHEARMNELMNLASEYGNSYRFAEVFSGMDLEVEFNSRFYNFLLKNFSNIIRDSDYRNIMGKTQRNYDAIRKNFLGREIDLADCVAYFKKAPFDYIDAGNEELAKLCMICRQSQSRFEKFQRLYNQQKQRTVSSIPHEELKVKSLGRTVHARMLRLDDPLTLVVGEEPYTNCCQQLDERADSCVKHSATSKNGRVFGVFDENNELLAQSWVWRNGNTICYDNIEATKLYKEHRIKNWGIVKKAYKEMASQLIRTDKEVTKEWIKQKVEELKAKYENDEGSITNKKEYLLELREIVSKARGQRLKAVTVGAFFAYNDMFVLNYGPPIIPTTKKPVERYSMDLYLDSQIQCLIKGNYFKGIRLGKAKDPIPMHVDKRAVKIKNGSDLVAADVERINTTFENEEEPFTRDIMEISSNGQNLQQVNVHIGEDWYGMYQVSDSGVTISKLNIAKTSSPDIDDDLVDEIEHFIVCAMKEAITEDGKYKLISSEIDNDIFKSAYSSLVKQKLVQRNVPQYDETGSTLHPTKRLIKKDSY